jgi:hypothetical protein
MATSQQFLMCDNSTYANYAQWASAISAQLAANTWAQSTDTGQVMWSGMSITAVSMTGSAMTCTYTSLTGLALAVGRALTVTGWTSGTFTAINVSGVNVASAGTGVVTQAAAAPGSAAFFYEIWTPNDGLTNFYMRINYGNISGTNSPTIQVGIGSSTAGNGTLTGILLGPIGCNIFAATAASATIPYECNFSGAAGRFGAMMWRNAPTSGTTFVQQFFAIERSISSTGTYTGTYVTLWLCGLSTSNPTSQNQFTGQQMTLYFGVGTTATTARSGMNNGGFVARVYPTGPTTFNGSQAFDLCTPMVGFFDYPCTEVGVVFGYPGGTGGLAGTLAEGVPFSTTVYGATRTYMPTAAQNYGSCGPANFSNTSSGSVAGFTLCMRFD